MSFGDELRSRSNRFQLDESPFEIPQLVVFRSPADGDGAGVGFMSSTSLSDFNKWDDFEIVDTDHYAFGCSDIDVQIVESADGEDENGGRKTSAAREGDDDATDVHVSERSACLQIHPMHVRWFYKQEVDKKWTPFIGYDSLRLEIRYRLSKDENVEPFLEGSLASMSQHDRELLFRTDVRLVVRGGLYEADLESRCCNSIFWTGERSVILRGTWFYDGTWQPLEDQFAEVVEDEHMKTFRRRTSADVIQTNNYRRTVSEAIHDVSFTDFRVEWYSKSEVYLYSEAKSSKIMRSVSERLGFQKSGYKLQRGYYVDATLEDRQPDITHLVFVVHGIGQKMDIEKIIRNCASLRKCSTWLKEKYFPHLNETNERSEFFPVEWRSSLKLDGDTVDSITPHRVRGLRDFLNCSAMDIMYYTSPLYRKELILGLQAKMNGLYTQFCRRNPHFERLGGRVSIMAHSLGTVISYDIITNWNPLELYGMYADSNPLLVVDGDGQRDGELVQKLNEARRRVYDLELQLRDASSDSQPRNGLLFAVENFFCLGSPLAVFLALRGVRPRGHGVRDDILPTSLVKRLFNIYHPTDPVAYRLEPLILKHYSTILPLAIHYYAASDKDPYEQMDVKYLPPDLSSMQDKRPHSPPQVYLDVIDSVVSSPNKPGGTAVDSRWSFYWPSFMRRAAGANALAETTLPSVMRMKLLETEIDEPIEEDVTVETDDDAVEAQDSVDDKRSPSPVASIGEEAAGYETPRSAELEHRLDYVLREGNLESSYISALTSHTSYWNSYDVAYFILGYLHPTAGQTDVSEPVSPPSPPQNEPSFE